MGKGRKSGEICRVLLSCSVMLFIVILVSFVYKTNAEVFQTNYIYRLILGILASIFPIYVTVRGYKDIIARSMKPWPMSIALIVSLVPLFFSGAYLEEKAYVWIHYVFLVALPEELFFRVYLPERFNEELLKKWAVSDVSRYIVASLLANMLWGLSHIIFPFITETHELEPLWSYITFGIANGWIYTILFVLFRKNIFPPMAVHAIMDISIRLL